MLASRMARLAGYALIRSYAVRLYAQEQRVAAVRMDASALQRWRDKQLQLLTQLDEELAARAGQACAEVCRVREAVEERERARERQQRQQRERAESNRDTETKDSEGVEWALSCLRGFG